MSDSRCKCSNVDWEPNQKTCRYCAPQTYLNAALHNEKVYSDSCLELRGDNAALTKKLNLIASMCGNPDPAEACRLILKECEG